ncbi:hypothetical protein [Pseudomonas kuykendallii]|uniref:hypothetical protein n=1 Tax=Pseudomonas kuykendallii TaxID=1007099 RepID=UPI0028D80F7F|nr:hypothetical protein [Pseudomonas kuykendallii]
MDFKRSMMLRALLLLDCVFIFMLTVQGSVFLASVLIFFGSYLCFALCEQDVSTPGVWMVLAVWLYHYSLPILVELGHYGPEYNEEIVVLPTCVIVLIFFLVLLFDKGRRFSDKFLQSSLYCSGHLYKVFLFLVLVYAFGLAVVAGGSKTEASLSGLGRLQIFQAFFVVSYCGNLICKLIKRTPVLLFVAANFLLALLLSVLTGERDVFAGIVIVSVLSVSIFFRLGVVKNFIFVSVGGLIFTILHFFRNFFSIGGMYAEVTRNVFVEFLAGEPRSAAQNFNTMVDYVGGNGYLGVGAFLNDFMSIFIFKSMVYFENATNWFNSYFYPEIVSAGGGVGYSLIANLYSYQGEVWVFGFFFIFVSLLLVLRRFSFDNPYLLLFYFSCIPIIIYSIRGDISILFGLLLRNVLPVFFVFAMCAQIGIALRQRSNDEYSD